MNKRKFLISVLAISILAIILFRIWTKRKEIFYESKVINSGYFYFKTSNCAQRVQMLDNIDALKNYNRWYSENGRNLDDGIYLEAFESKSLDPFELVNILSIDTLDNGLVYCHAYQNKYDGNTIVRRYEGYIIYEYYDKNKLNQEIEFCSEYLNMSWQNLYGRNSPDPR
ncbi:MAG: hypothetical protein ACJA2S_004620 [Cyclobacteriaceae bacterium]|jgi:hypothetical protein